MRVTDRSRAGGHPGPSAATSDMHHVVPTTRGLPPVLFGLLVAACSSSTTEPIGACTLAEPGAPTTAGAAAFAEHVTPTAGGGFGTGSLGVSVTCLTSGTAPDQFTLILPNLQRGQPVPLGDYTVRDPRQPLSAAELTDRRMAWARVRRGGDVPVLFAGQAGRVTITRSEASLLEGAFQVALAASDTAFALPGARAEVAGPIARDSSGAPLVSRTVIGGAFLAYREEADWRGK